MPDHPDLLFDVTGRVIRAACEVHAHLGPGYPEGTYEEALCVEFDRLDLAYARQVNISVDYKGAFVGRGQVDLLVAECVIVELKTVRRILRVHRSQVVSYLKAMTLKVGLILHFKVPAMQSGVQRVVLHDSLR